jgi:hypothetical protein
MLLKYDVSRIEKLGKKIIQLYVDDEKIYNYQLEQMHNYL